MRRKNSASDKKNMASLDYALTRQALAKGVARTVVDDTPIAIRLWYIGTGTVTSVTVTTATNIVMVTSDGGTDTYTFATYTTVGTLVDAINKDGIFHARVIDALRADATTASNFIDGAITAGADENGRTDWDVLVDTSSTDYMTVTLSPLGLNYETQGEGHRVHLIEAVYNVNVNAALANGFRIYRRRGVTETQIYRRASVDATETTVNFASGNGKITGNPDDEIIVRILDTTSITDAAANFVEIVGTFE